MILVLQLVFVSASNQTMRCQFFKCCGIFLLLLKITHKHQLTICFTNYTYPNLQKTQISLTKTSKLAYTNSKYQATTATNFIAKSKSHFQMRQLLTRAMSTSWWSSTSNIKDPYLYKWMDWLQKAPILHKRSKSI